MRNLFLASRVNNLCSFANFHCVLFWQFNGLFSANCICKRSSNFSSCRLKMKSSSLDICSDEVSHYVDLFFRFIARLFYDFPQLFKLRLLNEKIASDLLLPPPFNFCTKLIARMFICPPIQRPYGGGAELFGKIQNLL